MQKKLFILVSALLVTHQLVAQPLSLQEAIASALENNQKQT